MANYSITNSTLSAIGNALRYKLNENNYYKPSEMPNAISNIKSYQPQYPSGQFGQIYTFANGFANYELVSYATGSSMVGTDNFKISTGVGGANVYDKTVGDNHYIFSDNDAPIYLASAVSYAPEFFNYSKINTSFVKILHYPILNINNLYNFGFYNVNAIYCWYSKYVNDLSGLDKLKITEFSGGYTVNYFLNYIQVGYNSENHNAIYAPGININDAGMGDLVEGSRIYYSPKKDNLLWCGKYVRTCRETYGTYVWDISNKNILNVGTTHANCGASVIDAYDYCIGREDLKSAEVSAGLITAPYMYNGCTYMTDLYCNGGNNLLAIKNFYNGLGNVGSKTTEGCYIHFNINSPFIFDMYTMCYNGRLRRLPDIYDTIMSNQRCYMQLYSEATSPSFPTLEKTPNFGNIILSQQGGSSWGMTSCEFVNLGHIESLGLIGDLYVNGIIAQPPGGLRECCGSFPQNLIHGEKIGNIYANNIYIYSYFRGAYDNNMFIYSIYPNLEELHCSTGDLIAEKDIRYYSSYLQLTCNGNFLAPKLKTSGYHGDFISYNGNIYFYGDQEQGYWQTCPYIEKEYNNQNYFKGIQFNNIIAYNGNLEMGYLSGGLCGGTSEGYTFKNIHGQNINIYDLLYSGGDFGSIINYFGPRREKMITIDQIVAEHTLNIRQGLFSIASTSGDGISNALKLLKTFSTINLIKSDNLYINSGGYIPYNFYKCPNLINNEICHINMIEGNNIYLSELLSASSIGDDNTSVNNVCNMLSPYKLFLNIKCSNFIQFGNYMPWGQGRWSGSGYADGYQLYINLYYNHNSASLSPSCNFFMGVEKYTQGSRRNQRIILRIEKDSPFNAYIYNGGHSRCNDSYYYNNGEYIYENIFPNNLLTWQLGDNCYYNSIANIWVYYNL